MKADFLITSWNPEKTSLKDDLIKLGVSSNQIKFIGTERTSRPLSLNKAIRESSERIVFLLDDDISLAHVDLSRIFDIFNRYQKVGMVVVPVLQTKSDLVTDKPTPIDVSTPIEKSLKKIDFLATLNFVAIRKSLPIKFEEDFFGNQTLDVDYGWEIKRAGYKIVADCAQSVIHKTTDWGNKNLFYHAVVSRNFHVILRKWQNREGWGGVKAWNKAHNNEIPTIEELSHMPEKNLIQYINKFDQNGLKNFYFANRFTTMKQASSYIDFYEKVMEVPPSFQYFVDQHGMPNFNNIKV